MNAGEAVSQAAGATLLQVRWFCCRLQQVRASGEGKASRERKRWDKKENNTGNTLEYINVVRRNLKRKEKRELKI